MLSVLAALGICFCYMCVLWCLTGKWSYMLAIYVYGGCGQAPGHMCWLCVCVCGACVLVPAALWLYMKSGAWCAPDARGEWPL